MKKIATVLSVAALALTLAACGDNAEVTSAPPASPSASSSAPAPEPEAESAEPVAEPEPEVEETEEADEVGSRSNPAKYKDATVTLSTNGADEWEVGFTKVDLNANKEIAAENMFNDPPAKGNVYVMATVDAKYLGADSGLPWVDLDFQFVSADGRSYDTASVVTPDDLTDVADLYEGASGSGNVVFEVPSKDVDKGTLAISTMWGESPTFFTVK